MPLDSLIQSYLPAIEAELRQTLERLDGTDLDPLRYMLSYHLGWEGEGAGPEARGKRIRPILLLLTTSAAGGEWKEALPAAAAVELIHNFSLIHDDIEDNSPLRRGRPTVWKLWGLAHGINAGDAMFALANLAILRLGETTSVKITLEAARILLATCLQLTEGQFLDISYEGRTDLNVQSYWPMVAGKTAALLAACTELGALIAGAEKSVREAFRQFGSSLGLAFQAQDDLLGIWGDANKTGKSAESDLVSGKKSLPVLYGLGQNGPFSNRWAQGTISSAEVSAIADQLKIEGAYDYAKERANQLTEQALEALARARPVSDAGETLRSLALSLLNRQV